MGADPKIDGLRSIVVNQAFFFPGFLLADLADGRRLKTGRGSKTSMLWVRWLSVLHEQ